jgi:hypothetical protein
MTAQDEIEVPPIVIFGFAMIGLTIMLAFFHVYNIHLWGNWP